MTLAVLKDSETEDEAGAGPGESGGTAAQARQLAQAGEWTQLFLLVAHLVALRKASRPDSDECEEMKAIVLLALVENKDKIIAANAPERMAFRIAFRRLIDDLRERIRERKRGAGSLPQSAEDALDERDRAYHRRDVSRVGEGEEWDSADADPEDRQRLLTWHRAPASRQQRRDIRAAMVDNPLGYLLESEWDSAVCRAVDGLPPRQRKAVRLSYLRGLTYRELAHQMGCAPGTVGALLTEARATLREKLDGRLKKMRPPSDFYNRGTRGDGESSLF